VKVPAVRFGLRVARPLESSVAVPITVDTLPETLEKVIVPVGVGPKVPMTVATRTTCELGPGVDVAPKAVAVGMVVTRMLIAGEELGMSSTSPL
jgi:hypothetical protein